MKEAELTATLSGRNSKEGRSSKKEDTPEKAVPQLPLDEKTVEEASDLDSQDLRQGFGPIRSTGRRNWRRRRPIRSG